jgi:hypothetical protein
VSVQSGTLSFDGRGTSSGAAFTVAAGATLGFGGGNFTLTGGTYTVAGQTLVSGGTLTRPGHHRRVHPGRRNGHRQRHLDGDRAGTVLG